MIRARGVVARTGIALFVLLLWAAGAAFGLLSAVKRRRRGVSPARGQVLEHA